MLLANKCKACSHSMLWRGDPMPHLTQAAQSTGRCSCGGKARLPPLSRLLRAISDITLGGGVLPGAGDPRVLAVRAAAQGAVAVRQARVVVLEGLAVTQAQPRHVLCRARAVPRRVGVTLRSLAVGSAGTALAPVLFASWMAAVYTRRA